MKPSHKIASSIIERKSDIQNSADDIEIMKVEKREVLDKLMRITVELALAEPQRINWKFIKKVLDRNFNLY